MYLFLFITLNTLTKNSSYYIKQTWEDRKVRKKLKEQDDSKFFKLSFCLTYTMIAAEETRNMETPTDKIESTKVCSLLPGKGQPHKPENF